MSPAFWSDVVIVSWIDAQVKSELILLGTAPRLLRFCTALDCLMQWPGSEGPQTKFLSSNCSLIEGTQQLLISMFCFTGACSSSLCAPCAFVAHNCKQFNIRVNWRRILWKPYGDWIAQLFLFAWNLSVSDCVREGGIFKDNTKPTVPETLDYPRWDVAQHS